MNSETFSQLIGQVRAWTRENRISIIDILEMPDPLRQVLNWLVRVDGATTDRLAEYLQQDLAETNLFIDEMEKHKLVSRVDQNNSVIIRVLLTTGLSRKPTASKSILDDL